MTASMAFTTAKRNKKPITFSVDGTPFEFVPPKQAGIFLETVSGGTIISLTKETFDWLQEGLDAHLVRDEGDTSPHPSQYLIDRLKGTTEHFDVPDLEATTGWLPKKGGGRPTT